MSGDDGAGKGHLRNSQWLFRRQVNEVDAVRLLAQPKVLARRASRGVGYADREKK